MKELILGLAIMIAAIFVGCGSGIGLLPGINGCTGFGSSPTNIVRFGEGVANAYDPRCLSVESGQSVTWIGNFGAHPLHPGVAPSQRDGPCIGSPQNPIQNTDNGNSATFTFAAFGLYPYYCSRHEDQGMFGAICVSDHGLGCLPRHLWDPSRTCTRYGG